MPRPKKGRKVCAMPNYTSFGFENRALENCIIMTVDEYETVRLIDLEGLTQEQCAEHMEIARTTVQSIYANARKKLAECIVNGWTLNITSGEYKICRQKDGRCGQDICSLKQNNQAGKEA